MNTIFKQRRRYAYLILLALISIHFSLLGSDVDKIVKDIQTKYQKAKSLEIHFKEIDRFKLTGTSSEVFGTFIIKDKNNYRLDSEAQVIVANESTFWRYNKIENQVLIDYAKKDNQDVLLNNFLYDLQTKYFSQLIEEKKEGGKKIFVIKLTPKPSEESYFTSIKIWVEDKTWKIQRVVYDDYNENETEYLIEKIFFDKDYPDSFFTFVPPGGSDVVDVRY